MHKLLVLYPEPQNRQTFKEYYESVHLPLAAKMPGLISWRYSLGVASEESPAPYFAVYEADFDSLEAMGKALSSPEGQAVQADVPNYATGGAKVLHYEVAS
ncbi:EthD family reductase [Pseudarthrobacter oxydans]|uniref:EthD family reductase n=1 Tax=Pseudarthrobacter oxydans TaxID=1671 RepID=UPI00380B66F8